MKLSVLCRPTGVLSLIAVTAFAGVGLALLAQHGFDIRPCPWCVMQRGLFLILGSVAALGALACRWRLLQQALTLLVTVTAGLGVTAAVYQHQVASQLASCDMTFADRVLQYTGLEELWPSVFMVTASCMDAAKYRLLGQPYEVWSGLLFVSLGAAALWSLRRR